MPLRLFILFIFAAGAMLSCTKDRFITGPEARISVSADSLLFDTVFTTTGSVTHSFKLYNTNNRKLRLENISLMGGNNSSFSINIDGMEAHSVSNVEMEAGDSLYVFVNVSIDPTAENLPFVVQDSIRIAFNGNERFVQLQAWGRNARFLRNHTISGEENWNNDLPYVIIGALQVEASARLNIAPGTEIFLHADAPVLVDGTLNAMGTQEDSIVFRGDRLDPVYSELPASWPGIVFRQESKNNKFRHVSIRNAYQGIILDGPAPDGNWKLELESSTIENIYDAGILAAASTIRAVNCLIAHCGANVSLGYGGIYEFTHCTIASYGTSFIQHKLPVVQLSNFVNIGGVDYEQPLEAVFTNCVIWGDNGIVDNEITADIKGNLTFDIQLRNCLYKRKTDTDLVTSVNSVKNTAPEFVSIQTGERIFNYRLQPNSPGADLGMAAGILLDRDGNSRDPATPDAGCYEIN